jgi:hypothetical protein
VQGLLSLSALSLHLLWFGLRLELGKDLAGTVLFSHEVVVRPLFNHFALRHGHCLVSASDCAHYFFLSSFFWVFLSKGSSKTPQNILGNSYAKSSPPSKWDNAPVFFPQELPRIFFAVSLLISEIEGTSHCLFLGPFLCIAGSSISHIRPF